MFKIVFTLILLPLAIGMYVGSRNDERIQKMWGAMMGIFEVKEIYDERYEALLRRQ